MESRTLPWSSGGRPCHWARRLPAAPSYPKCAWKQSLTRCRSYLIRQTPVRRTSTVSISMRSCHAPRRPSWRLGRIAGGAVEARVTLEPSHCALRGWNVVSWTWAVAQSPSATQAEWIPHSAELAAHDSAPVGPSLLADLGQTAPGPDGAARARSCRQHPAVTTSTRALRARLAGSSNTHSVGRILYRPPGRGPLHGERRAYGRSHRPVNRICARLLLRYTKSQRDSA